MPEPTDVIVTCHTDGCGNADQPIRMPGGVEMDGEWMPMDSYSCGVCGQPIEDVRSLGGRLDDEPPPTVDNSLPLAPEPKDLDP
jgi:hypothetical protein